MTRTIVTRSINAAAELVFDTIAHIGNYKKAVPHIVRVEILSDAKSGVGTRFRETRLMNGKEMTTELEVTEFADNEHIRIVSDAGGTIWDTLFTVAPKDGGCELILIMDARAHKLLAKFVNPLIKGMVAKAIEKDLDAVKAYCEGLNG